MDGRIDDIFDPSKVPGSTVYLASNGTDLGMQAIFAGSFFIVFILLFSALRLRWPFIFSPRTRLTITSPPYLSRRFFGWFLATMRTPEAYILNTLGLDTVIFLRFYKMCMRLLLDVAFFSIVIIWPINIYWSKTNLDSETVTTDSGAVVPVSYTVTDYLFNLTLNISDPRQQWYLVPHIVFVYVFSALAYYHISKFSSRWASLRWHFLMQSRHALVSRTVMLTGVPRHLAKSPRELEWFWSSGLQLGKIERVRVCPFNTRLTSSAKERAKYLVRLEHAYKRLLGNPCLHPDYDPERLRALAMDTSSGARAEERKLLEQWAKPSSYRTSKGKVRLDVVEEAQIEEQLDGSAEKTPKSNESVVGLVSDSNAVSASTAVEQKALARPTVWIKQGAGLLQPWKRVDAIDHWRERFLAADRSFRQLRDSVVRGEDEHGHSSTAFVTFEDAATAHMVTQLLCYPNPGYMKARLAPEPRGVHWPNIWIPNHRKWAGFTVKWACIIAIWAFWSVPVILFSSLLTPASLGKVFPAILSSEHNLLRAFLSTTVPSVFLLLFLNMLPWILKQVHFLTGVRTKPDIDYSVMTKMWAFLVFNVILVFGFSGTFWNLIVDAINQPGTIMQKLASSIPRVGTFFTGYILVLGVGYQPFKLLQLRPVIWHIGRQWLCNTPRDYARLVSPVYIDWYSVYPYPLLVFGIAMLYSTFSPPVVLGAVVYYAIGYPVMKYLLLYVYFHPFETAGMAWPKVCRRMILAIMLYQVVMLTFVIVKGGGWYTFSLMPAILMYLWFFYSLGWSMEKQGTVLPMYLWRHPPLNSSYPQPPDQDVPDQLYEGGYVASDQASKNPFFAATPGTDNTFSPVLAPYGLRRRHHHLGQVGSSGSEAPSENGGTQATASIIGVEGGQNRRHLGLRARVQWTFQQVRDYFLAEFRPAAPILDLTYDRLYSQGIEDDNRQASVQPNGDYVEDNGDVLPPLRQIIGKVLPSHKNSLPPPRAPLTSRMVSELNYLSRHSATPSSIPARVPPPLATSPEDAGENESDQLLMANYQRYAVERQSNFEADENTDYQQTPMLNVRGILDRGIQDYVHPGLVGELPTLWLPVKPAGTGEPCAEQRSGTFNRLGRNSRSPTPADSARLLATSAPYRRIIGLLREHQDTPLNCTDTVAAIIAAAAAAAGDDGFVAAGLARPATHERAHDPAYSELQEVCVHNTRSQSSAIGGDVG
ncbi:hypothetical protein GGF46_001783 [Coemansia sp. RSA 552]|nr:hypothetical protein GGF46_001783 [Coemansia sp. RSA 552]